MIGQRISPGGIVFQDLRLLLVRLQQEDKGDFWVMPGGGIEADEGSFQATEREVREETNLTMKPERIAYVEGLIDDGRYVCKFWVVCHMINGCLGLEQKTAEEDCLQEVGFFSKEELQGMDAFPSTVKDVLWKGLDAGFPTIKHLGYQAARIRTNGLDKQAHYIKKSQENICL
jgi:ADP-ribose pyrophosphatase YjhB (NUDIX family)